MTYEFIQALKRIVTLTAQAYQLLIFANIIMSWVRPDPYNPVVRFIRGMTEPLFDVARRTLPFLRAGMIDFSPIAVILLLQLVTSLLIQLLDQIGEKL